MRSQARKSTKRNPTEKRPQLVGAASAEAEALIGRLVRNEKGAWDEFHRRHMPAVKKHIVMLITRYWKSLLSSDSKDDVLSRFYLSIVDNGSKRLRAFDPARGCSFDDYLCMIAREAVTHEMRRLVGKVGESLNLLEVSDAGKGVDQRRGAAWVANPIF